MVFISDCCKEPIGCIYHPIYSRSYRAYATHLFTLCVVGRCQRAGQVCYDAVHLVIRVSGFRPSLYTFCHSNNSHPPTAWSEIIIRQIHRARRRYNILYLNNYRAKIQQKQLITERFRELFNRSKDFL